MFGVAVFKEREIERQRDREVRRDRVHADTASVHISETEIGIAQ